MLRQPELLTGIPISGSPYHRGRIVTAHRSVDIVSGEADICQAFIVELQQIARRCPLVPDADRARDQVCAGDNRSRNAHERPPFARSYLDERNAGLRKVQTTGPRARVKAPHMSQQRK